MMQVDAGAALAWRLARHALGRAPASGVADVAQRVLAARAWPLEGTEAAFAVRLDAPVPHAVEHALKSGELMQGYAFRGGSYVFTPEVASVLLPVRKSSRAWESRRFQAQGGFEIDDWSPFRAAVTELLADGPATRAEIAAHLRTIPSLRGLATAAETGAGADSLYKPLHWWGDIAFGPPRDGGATFRLLKGDPRWPDPPDVDDAGRRAVRDYLRAYGPATAENIRYWLTEGLSAPKRQVADWLASLGDEVTTVEADGFEAYVLTRDLDAIREARPSQEVRLLPAYDPWLFGPGTADARIVPPKRRQQFSTGKAPVIRGGYVVGTWRRGDGEAEVSWFDEQ